MKFIEVKENTKEGNELTCLAIRYRGFYLTDCYKSPSKYKQDKYYFWLNKCIELDGSYFRICSYNNYDFTLSFATADALYYITPYYNYKILKNKMWE